MKLIIRETERSLLEYLIERHIEEGCYFGRKEQHYKMCKDLLEKFNQSNIKKMKDLIKKQEEIAQELFEMSDYYLDDKKRVRLDIDQKELERYVCKKCGLWI